MHILQFLTSVSLISLVASATTPEPEYPFRLRVWKNWKGGAPYLDAQPEIDAWGDFIVNKTQGYAGFLSKLTRGAYRGELVGVDNPGQGYLQPLETPGHYQFKWARKYIPFIINQPGVLSQNFTRGGQDCGGNCGGITMRYDAKPYGEGVESSAWFIVPNPRYGPGVYFVRYTTDSGKYPLPTDAYYVYMWARG
ncbi:hypothetical protein BZA77DRAFT_301628 [Pyronema omphalodes]|nr:hypothetical protein BZA77DRAFT_301628 [Pyronema omphalodes]